MVTGILLVLLYRTARALLKTQSTMERPGEQKRGEAAAGMANEFGLVRPVVAILVGVPGQGKSTVADEIKRAEGAVDVTILCQDDVPQHKKRGRRQVLEKQLRKGLMSRKAGLADGSRGKPVLFVVDRVNWNQEQRAHFLKECEYADLDESRCMAIFVTGATPEECLRRVLVRPKCREKGSTA